MRRTRVVAVVAVALAATCHHAAPASAATDSIRGHVRVVGVEALPRLTLVPDDGQLAVRLLGPPSLRRVDGLDVDVFGTRAGDLFTVQRFVVVAANGVPATDGRLVADGATIDLVTADGARHALVSPSPNLRANVGHRVWVSGPLDHPPVAYGVIE
jgi:hypothetical protein